MSVADLLDLVTRGGSTAVLLLIVWAFYTDRIVTMATHKRVLRERDEFKQEWSDALRLLGQSTTVSDKALSVAAETHGSTRLQAQRQVRSRDMADDDGG